MSRVVPVAFGVLLLGLVALASQGNLIASTVAVAFAFAVALISALGPRNVGTLAILAAMALAPMDDLRPGESLLTFADLAFGVGFLLLVPTILANRPRLPGPYILGSLILVSSTLLTACFTDDLATHFSFFLRFLAAVIMLPIAFAWWRPSPPLLRWLAWAYVLGQCISTAYAVVGGPEAGGRDFGLTRHPNFLGLGSIVAIALCLFLHSRVGSRERILVWGAAAVCGYGVVLSGSRAALLAVLVMALLFPVIERSLVAAYLLVVGGLATGLSFTALVQILGPTSAIGRLMPGDYGAELSDQARELALQIYWPRFLSHPIVGEGFKGDQYTAHNVFLQMGVALGVIGLIGWLVLLWSLGKPLFDGTSPLRNLGFLAVGYAVVCPITPSIWDRNIWAGLALAILAGVPHPSPDDDPVDDSEPTEAEPALEHQEAT